MLVGMCFWVGVTPQGGSSNLKDAATSDLGIPRRMLMKWLKESFYFHMDPHGTTVGRFAEHGRNYTHSMCSS